MNNPETMQFSHHDQNNEELIAFRENQSSGSRLCEHITGLRPENPEIVDRLIEDQKLVRAKYRLPLELKGCDPNEYERLLKKIAKDLGVAIRSTLECGSFFVEHPLAGAVSFGADKKVGVNINRSSFESLYKSLVSLEHELIHQLQSKYYSSMPIEVREYEAYVAGMNFAHLKEKFDLAIVEIFFSYFIGSSVRHWYASESKVRKKTVEPEWDTSAYFLKTVDNIKN